MKKVVKNMLMLSVGQGLILFVGAISTLFYGIIFSKPQIAVISLFDMVTQLFFSFGYKWSSMGIIRFGKEELDEFKKINHTSSVRLILLIPITVISVFLILFYRDAISHYMGMNDNSLIVYLIVSIIITVVNDHITVLLNTDEKYGGILFLRVAESLGRCIIISVIVIYHINITTEAYIKIMIYWPILLFFLRIPFLKLNYLFPMVRAPMADIIKFFKFVYPQIYGFVGLYLINWMDTYFIRHYSNLENLGAYQFVYTVFVKICTFAFIFNNIFFPKIMSWKKHGDKFRLNRYIRQIPAIVFFVSMAAVLVMVFSYKPFFMHFFKDKFTIAYPAFNILLLTIPFFMATYIYIPVLNCYDKVKWIQITNIVSAFVNFLIDYFFIKKYGIIAAAIGTFMCYFLKCFLLMISVKRLRKNELSEL